MPLLLFACALAHGEEFTTPFPISHLEFAAGGTAVLAGGNGQAGVYVRRDDKFKKLPNSSDYAISPDGTHVIYVDSHDETVVGIYSVEDTKVQRKIALKREVRGVAFSPDSKRVAWLMGPTRSDVQVLKAAIAVADVDTGHVKMVDAWVPQLKADMGGTFYQVNGLTLRGWNAKGLVVDGRAGNPPDPVTQFHFFIDANSEKLLSHVVYGRQMAPLATGEWVQDDKGLVLRSAEGDPRKLFDPQVELYARDIGSFGIEPATAAPRVAIFGTNGTRNTGEYFDVAHLDELPLGTAYLWVVDVPSGTATEVFKSQTHIPGVEAALSGDGKQVAYRALENLTSVVIRSVK